MKIITISGASGSGKSTAAELINQSMPTSLLLSLDRYYLSKNEQIEKNGFCNFDNPAAIDVDLLKKHLVEFKRFGMANVPIYDFTISQRAGYEELKASNNIIIDGIFAGSVIGQESNLSVFVDVDLDLALLRRIQRDMIERDRSLKSVIEQYTNFVRPAYFEYVKNIKANADIIISNNRSTEEFVLEAYNIIKLIERNEFPR